MQDAAAAFCAAHGLPDDVIEPLAAHLADHLARSGNAASHAGDDSASRCAAASPRNAAHGAPGGEGAAASEDGGKKLETFDTCGWADELPAAAGEPAEALLYTAPLSPAKRPGAAKAPLQPAQQQTAASGATQEDGAPVPMRVPPPAMLLTMGPTLRAWPQATPKAVVPASKF